MDEKTNDGVTGRGFTGGVPDAMHNKAVSYEETVLGEHKSIINGVRDTALPQVYLETQARLFVGICLPGHAEQFIETRYSKYYSELAMELSGGQLTGNEFSNTVRVRAWTRIINEAVSDFILRYKIAGSKVKIAVLDDWTPEGKKIIEMDTENPNPLVHLQQEMDAVSDTFYVDREDGR